MLILFTFTTSNKRQMKTFNDIIFEKHHVFENGAIGRLFFDNGFGISVISGKGAYANEGEYEIAVLFGNKDEWEITYNTDITDDVIGYLSPDAVTEFMLKIQAL